MGDTASPGTAEFVSIEDEGTQAGVEIDASRKGVEGGCACCIQFVVIDT